MTYISTSRFIQFMNNIVDEIIFISLFMYSDKLVPIITHTLFNLLFKHKTHI